MNWLALIASAPLAALVVLDGIKTLEHINSGRKESGAIRRVLIKALGPGGGTIGVSVLVAIGLLVLSLMVPVGVSMLHWVVFNLCSAVAYWVLIGKSLREMIGSH